MILCYINIVYMRLVYTTMHAHAGKHRHRHAHTHMLYPCTNVYHIHARTHLDFDGCIYFPFEAKPSKLSKYIQFYIIYLPWTPYAFFYIMHTRHTHMAIGNPLVIFLAVWGPVGPLHYSVEDHRIQDTF